MGEVLAGGAAKMRLDNEIPRTSDSGGDAKTKSAREAEEVLLNCYRQQESYHEYYTMTH